MPLENKEEKKVEYLELIYDLIFVYIIGRNNSLLQDIENGFVSGFVFMAYILGSLALIQIWNFSTFYTNMYGRNGVRDHVFMFTNMYLLYYIGEGTRVHWIDYQIPYNLAWALILINIGVQYAIERHAHPEDEDLRHTAKGMMIALFGEAAIILISIPFYSRIGAPMAAVAILFGVVATWLFSDQTKATQIDFPHLTERAMLYVVFTFGEMIIAIAAYFEGGIDASSTYFSFMCFLIVAGLFLCYEFLYNRIIDRQQQTSGMLYMLIHIALIFGMNFLTTSLEFMQDEEILLWPKILMLTFAFLLCFASMFLLLLYAKPDMKRCGRFVLPVAGISAAFAVLLIALREQMYVNILISVLYVWTVCLMLYRFSRRTDAGRLQEAER